ncbi:MAG: protein-L-isoaspartate(D-aspartate) O-methyltransferase [Natronospirillum sp.]
MSSTQEKARLLGVGMTSERTRRRMIERLQSRGIIDAEVLKVMASVPRHIFVDEALAHRAYDDTSLPIGYGQTLSNSYTVARMTSLLREAAPAEGLQRVLEIGTGSGYQTAVLSHLAPELYTVERIEPLQEKARARCRLLGLQGIRFHLSDGHWGWERNAPYDAILCTAAPEAVPEALLAQLRPEGGVLVLPVGDQTHQQLVRVVRQGDDYTQHRMDEALFVPLVSGKKAG